MYFIDTVPLYVVLKERWCKGSIILCLQLKKLRIISDDKINFFFLLLLWGYYGC